MSHKTGPFSGKLPKRVAIFQLSWTDLLRILAGEAELDMAWANGGTIYDHDFNRYGVSLKVEHEDCSVVEPGALIPSYYAYIKPRN